jgi:putative aminopeptidase FrvX
MRKELAHICQKKNLPWTMDVFLGYGSDSEPVLKKGVNAKTALIGPGVDSSHSVERTHWDAVDATYTLMEEYCRQFATR